MTRDASAAFAVERSTPAEIDAALQRAAEVAPLFVRTSGKVRAALLRRCAQELELRGDVIVERAQAETSLPEARLRGELARTCNQLRLFADLVYEGSWVDARIDRADPARMPVPKPDVRSMRRGIGPIAVFGASNFPLAFSVAGGDTASALAAGNPVVVKAHPAHPGTSALAGEAIAEAVRATNLPSGVLAVLFDDGIELGLTLVRDPRIKGVGFTGSRRAGRALMDAAAARREPIPVFAEMSSVNPVFVLSQALAQRGEQIAAALHASFTGSAGQLCTCPGLVFVERGATGDAFVAKVAELTSTTPAATMLTAGIADAYRNGILRLEEGGARSIARGAVGDARQGSATLLTIDVEKLLTTPELADEVFGPSTLLVRYGGLQALHAFARTMEGNLTATLHATERDLRDAGELIAALERRVGRLILNGFPTGVEVCHAMVHGGPFPATSDGASTSVGTRAIERFTRLVCYQDFPEAALPEELQDSNPLGILRLVDGRPTRDALPLTIS